jgi:uncharacterized protein YlxW (UPF0749 family)
MATSDYKVVKNDRLSTIQLPAVTGTFPQRRGSLLSFQLLLGAAGLLIGLLLAVQWRSTTATNTQPASRDATRQQVSTSISQFEQEQNGLKQQVAQLRAELNTLQQQSAANQNSRGNAQQLLNQEQIAAGLVPLHGPGIIVTFDDSKVTNLPPNADTANYIIHEYDLRDGINALLGGGAEAISLNGERLISTSSVYCVGSTIIVNSTRLSPPYVIYAIGDGRTLQDAITHSPQISKFMQRKVLYQVILNVQPADDVSVPEFKSAPAFKYATPVEGN